MPLRYDLELTGPVDGPPLGHQFDGFAVEHVTFGGEAAYEYARQGDSWYLALHDLLLSAGATKLDDGQDSDRLDLRDTITLLPPGIRIEGWSELLPRANSFTALVFVPALLDVELGRAFEQQSPPPLLYGRSKALSQTLRKISLAMHLGHGGRLPLEHLAIVAAFEALAITGRKMTLTGALSPRQLEHAVDYILAHLTDDLSLADVAKAAGLSRFHFTRAFQISTGASPYTFITAKRAELAAVLLVTTVLPLEAVARRSGLGSAINLRRAMVKTFGSTPTKYRDAARREP